MKKILAVMMALAMVLCLAVSVSAEETVLFEGDVTLKGENYWCMVTTLATNDNYNGQVIPMPEDWSTVSKIVLTSDTPFTFGIRLADGNWDQPETAVAKYEVNFAESNVLVVDDQTVQKSDGSGVAVPEFLVAISAADGVDYTVHYVIYGEAAAADAPAAEDTSSDEAAEAPADDTAAADQGTEDGTAADNNTVAPEDTSSAEAPSTGLALAVLPAVVAMAAAVVAKKH